MTAGQRIRRERERRGLTREALAAKINAGASQIKNLENSDTLPVRSKVVPQIEALFGIDLSVVGPDLPPPATNDLSDEQLLAVAQLHLAELASRFAARGGSSAMDPIPITLSRTEDDRQGDDQQQQ